MFARIVSLRTIAFAFCLFLDDALAFEFSLNQRKVSRAGQSSDVLASGKCPYTAFKKLIGLDSDTKQSLQVDWRVFNRNVYQIDQPSTRISTSSIIPDVFFEAITSPIPIELWCTTKMEESYEGALSQKCPFLRRRATDILDAIDLCFRRLVPYYSFSVPVPPSLRCDGQSCEKDFGLSKELLLDVIRSDWKPESKKGYYVTGRLSPSIYRDDCVFDGPDPDMPVKGLRKYQNAASQLFDRRSSHCDLLTLKIESNFIKATWKFNGTLRLPWRPQMPVVFGTTTYHIDATGLIFLHEETWDNMTAIRAFFETFLPNKWNQN